MRPAPIDDDLLAEVQRRLTEEHPDLLADMDHFRRRIRLRGAIGTILRDRQVDGESFAEVLQVISDRIVGLGPLEPLLRDPAINEVMVNGPGHVFIERGGRIERAEIAFEDEVSLLRVIERILSPLGLRVDGSQPWVDARLPDGSRVHAILPPLAPHGPVLTVRRFARRHPSLDELISWGALSEALAETLRVAVTRRRNILVVGGTGSGKTTLLRALCGEIPADERVITIEDVAELALQREHVVPLESRPPNIEGRGEVTIRDLVRQALRMRPDRLIIGEVRGPEVLDMLAAMNTGHEGSMSSAHANTAHETVARLEAMAAGSGPAVNILQRQIAAALDLIVEVRRSDGERHVEGLFEVVLDRDAVTVRPAS